MDDKTNKSTGSHEFDDILVLRKKKANTPPPSPEEDKTILTESSEEETANYNIVDLKVEVLEKRGNRRKFIVIAGLSIAFIAVLLLGMLMSLVSYLSTEPDGSASPKKEATSSIVKTYKNIKNKLEEIKKTSAELGLKELAEGEDTPAQKAVEAAQQKEQVDNPYSAYDLLPPEKFSEVLLKMISIGKKKEAEACLAGAFITRPKDMQFHENVRKFIQLSMLDNVEEFYAKTALLCGETPAISVIRGNIFASRGSWSNAAKAYSAALEKVPDIAGLEKKKIFAMARAGNEMEAFTQYEKYLAAGGLPENKKAIELLPLTLLFSSHEKADALLKLSSKYPEDSDDFRYFQLCRDAIFGKLKPSSFSEWDPDSLRELNIISLLSEGRENDVLLMRVPPNKSPDLWKTFIHWRNNSNSWKAQAELLYEKNSTNGGDPVKKIAAALLLGKDTPDKLLGETAFIPPEKRPLIYFFAAEFSRKNADAVKADEFYKKAASIKGNIYNHLIEHYSQLK
ncbi:MAG: hypothetical protein A2020_10550 [Lentisphaerae bacterium GWF2_45_14]|nr:MAG: hypothetical protein A2020_10550 [Lentisphaerae bacterium GWF2_45_14]